MISEKLKIYKAQWYQKNKKKHDEQTNIWSKNNRDKINVWRRKWRAKNRKRLLAMANDKRRLDPVYREHQLILMRKSYRRNRAKRLIYNAKQSRTIKVVCRRKFSWAVRSGKIIRPTNCEACNKDCKPDGHHKNYKKPFDVIWLCKFCHADVHRH